MCRACTGRLFKVGGHASDSVYLQISVFAAAKLLGCFKGSQCVFCKIA